ncbi:MAG: IclR family transcriptional regulator [Clostridioides sp.]|jgi:DNA-binding IclR family transcriptional regulator|nr:IclR family transcriptional regulator [Clostridioides sp.]
MSNESKVKSAGRALRFLELLAKNRNGISFTEIKESMDIPKSSAHSLIQEFIDNKYIIYNDEKKLYYVGVEFIKLCTECMQNTNLTEELSLLTETIAKELNQTTHAGILDRSSIVYLSKYEVDIGISLMNSVGIKLPAHCTALGKILLSQFSDKDLIRMYEGVGFTKLTKKSIDSIDNLIENMNIVRKNNYAIEVGESSDYTACIALPIVIKNEMIAAVSTSLPIETYKKSDINHILKVMKYHVENTQKRFFD